MKAVFIVFPNQLFQSLESLDANCEVILIEEYLFFKQYCFHKQKIAFHRATMQFYKLYLEQHHFKVRYIESANTLSDIRQLIPELATESVQKINFYDVVDDYLGKRIVKGCDKHKIVYQQHPTQLFLNSEAELDAYFKTKKRFFQTDFYIYQRKNRAILITQNQKPIGDKWTFDDENRLKYPKTKIAPTFDLPTQNNFTKEANKYVEAQFNTNYGQIKFNYPTTFAESEAWLDDFLKNRFIEFGSYEDAMVSSQLILHHSVITPMLNVGLLTPQQVLDKVLFYSSQHPIPLNSLEGFVRQIVGWREFIRAVYIYKGTEERTMNFWKFKRKIPASFWTGTTGIEPVDVVIKKVLTTGYCHHIERLMVLGNFMLLCEFDPDEVYRWFMELFIDSYDWVMVTNIYGMSQFADGGLMATKPYISGSNYLIKMSDFKKGEWQTIWDALFWHFMNKQRAFFLQNPRLGMLVNLFDKMDEQKRNAHIEIAQTYLSQL